MSGLTLDAGALIAFERNDQAVIVVGWKPNWSYGPELEERAPSQFVESL